MNSARLNSVRKKEINLTKKVDLYYGVDIADAFTDHLNRYDYDKIFVISDKLIHDLHGRIFFETLLQNNVPACMHLIDASEDDKTMAGLPQLCDDLLNENVTKDSIIISFGGGVTGNIAGLAAALIFRGIRYIEVPTTFMGMTDSTLSNKQAVNGATGKNQIGTYHAPLFVWSDMCYATTESRRYFNAALTEAVKNGLIREPALLSHFKRQDEVFDHTDPYQLLELFELITDVKNKILADDPTEKGYAVILEYGHTFGHAIEYLTHGQVIHGEAVAAGMCMAAEVSNQLGYLSDEDADLHYDLLKEHFPKNMESPEIAPLITPGKLMEQIKNDNKRSGSGVKYVLLERPGVCLNPDGDYAVAVPDETISESIRLFYQQLKLLKEEW